MCVTIDKVILKTDDRDTNMKDIIVLIPALDPDTRLIEYCSLLKEAGIETVILVDDGSDSEYAGIFLELDSECMVLRHGRNMGKGRALKDAFSLICSGTLPDTVSYEGDRSIEEWISDISKAKCVVTADSDGQHTVEDVLKVGRQAYMDEDALVLGARDFDSDNVPFKSRKGNKLTRELFSLLHGLKLTDTQTGLRGIPVKLLPEYMDGKGERFEYELDMLVITAREHIPVTEIPIETIYENDNSGTHFRAVRDSISVYKILFATFFKYLLASLTSFVLDILIFRLFLTILGGLSEEVKISLSTVSARIVSSIYNFFMNKYVVFIKEGDMARSAIGYYVLCVMQTAASAGAVILLHRLIPIPETYVKILVDSMLFVISYQVQKRIIFKR